MSAIGLAGFRGLAAEVEARLLRITHRPRAGSAADMARHPCRRVFRRCRRRRFTVNMLARLGALHWGMLGPGDAMGLRQRLAVRGARLAGARKPAGDRCRRRATARLWRRTRFTLDRRGTAGQAKAVRLADHRIAGDATQDRCDLAGGLALPPEFPQSINPLLGPFHVLASLPGLMPQDVVSK